MPFVSGYLKVQPQGPQGPVDPDYGVEIGGPGIDNSLPPGTPPIGGTLPEPPPGVWPPPSFSRPVVPTHPIYHPDKPTPAPTPPGTPSHPIAGAPPRPARPIMPGAPVRPDQGLPGGTTPIRPTHPIAPPVGPSHPIVDVPPGTIWPPTPGAPPGTFWVVAGIPGVGWRYVCVDPSLRPDNTLPVPPTGEVPPAPDQGLPPAPDQGLPPETAPPVPAPV